MTALPDMLPEIWSRLDRITEPCSIAMGNPVSLVEMGLIDDVSINDQGCVSVVMCLTDAASVHYLCMQAYITNEVSCIEGVTSVQVRQTLDSFWTPDRRQRRCA